MPTLSQFKACNSVMSSAEIQKIRYSSKIKIIQNSN